LGGAFYWLQLGRIGEFTGALAQRRRRRLRRGDNRGALAGGGSGIVIIEQHGPQALAHVPFDMAGEHAQEDLGAHPRRDRPSSRKLSRNRMAGGEPRLGTDSMYMALLLALHHGCGLITSDILHGYSLAAKMLPRPVENHGLYWLKSKNFGLVPLGFRNNHINVPAVTFRTDQLVSPFDDAGFAAVTLRVLGGIGFDLMLAIFAPHNQANTSRGSVPS
jgi:hypothetical protein